MNEGERQTGIRLKPAARIWASVFSLRGAEEERQVTLDQGTMQSATVLEEICRTPTIISTSRLVRREEEEEGREDGGKVEEEEREGGGREGDGLGRWFFCFLFFRPLVVGEAAGAAAAVVVVVVVAAAAVAAVCVLCPPSLPRSLPSSTSPPSSPCFVREEKEEARRPAEEGKKRGVEGERVDSKEESKETGLCEAGEREGGRSKKIRAELPSLWSLPSFLILLPSSSTSSSRAISFPPSPLLLVDLHQGCQLFSVVALAVPVRVASGQEGGREEGSDWRKK